MLRLCFVLKQHRSRAHLCGFRTVGCGDLWTRDRDCAALGREADQFGAALHGR